jgi:tripartite ATP-independent transporter DctM subunit
MSEMSIGIWGIVLMVVLIFLRMPVAFAMALTGFLGLACISGFDVSISNMGIVSYSTIGNFNMAVLPLFLLMGNVAGNTGISRDIYKTSHVLFGRVRGGLAMATVLGCGGFAAICGSSAATAAAMGTVALPEMKKFNYDTRLSVGCMAAGGTLGFMIPPSIGFIMYAILTQESVGKLFMAGILPGLLQILLYLFVVWLICFRNPEAGPAGDSTSLFEKIKSFKGLWPMLLLFFLVMGGLYMGAFTPTEAGAIGAFGAFIIGFVRRRLNREGVVNSFVETGKATALVLFLMFGAMAFTQFMAITKIPFALANIISGFDVNRYVILVGILLFYVLIGCIFDVMAAMILTLPILFPVIIKLGFDPIWYGVLMIRVVEIGQITPPFGLVCFVLAGATKMSPGIIFRGIMPFLASDLVMLPILIFFPQISLLLPNMMG